MRTLLPALIIILLGIGTSVATFLYGGKTAKARIQTTISQILEASEAAAAIKSPEQDVLQDPPMSNRRATSARLS